MEDGNDANIRRRWAPRGKERSWGRQAHLSAGAELLSQDCEVCISRALRLKCGNRNKGETTIKLIPPKEHLLMNPCERKEQFSEDCFYSIILKYVLFQIELHCCPKPFLCHSPSYLLPSKSSCMCSLKLIVSFSTDYYIINIRACMSVYAIICRYMKPAEYIF